MFCLRSRVPASGFRVLRPQTTTPLQSIPSTTTSRLFSSALTRPLQTTTSTSTSPFRTPTITSLTSSSSATSSPFAAATQQSRSFSASASLGAKRNTYNPSRLVQKRRHGFLARLRTRGGRRVLIRRRQRGKKALSW